MKKPLIILAMMMLTAAAMMTPALALEYDVDASEGGQFAPSTSI